MDRLQSALDQLAENVGGFDNIKLLLDGGQVMSRDAVADHLENITSSIGDGTLKASHLNEESLRDAVFPA